MKISNREDREKRDWSLLIFIVPIGIFLMMIAGQIAVRIVPNWSVIAGMQSNLDLKSLPNQPAEAIQPVLPDILTPVSWFDTFLTPNSNSSDNAVYPPFIVFEASATPPPANTGPTTVGAASTQPTSASTSSAMSTAASSSASIVTTTKATKTQKPPKGTGTPTPATTCTDPLATNNGGALPCTYPPTPATTCTDPLATNNGGSLPCAYPPTPPTTCTDPLATNNGGPLPCTYPPTPPPPCTDPNANNVGSPLPCTYPTPSPAALVGIPDSGTPSGYNYGTPDNSVAGVADGHYVIINLSATPIVVNGISDTGYDLVYYERATGSGSTLGIDMDKVILSISMDNSTYYVVFNWGDGTPDANSSVASVAGTEADNQHINAVDLYQDPSATSSPKTGIEIDVDNAPSHPPPGNYSYLAIQAPAPPASSDGADVDSVQVLP